MVTTTLPADALRTALDAKFGRLREMTGLPVVFGGPVVRTASAEYLVIEKLEGNHSRALQGLVVHRGRGLGGLALARARPLVVNDYRSNRVITHHFDRAVVEAESLSAVFAFPVLVHGRVEGVLYGASREEMPIGDVALRRAGEFATLLADDVARLLAQAQPDAAALTSAQALAELEAIAGRLLDPTLRSRLLQVHRSLAGPGAADPLEPTALRLTPREQECLALAAVGATNAAIGVELELSPETVKAYLRNAMRKLNVTNRTGAVHIARKAGLI